MCNRDCLHCQFEDCINDTLTSKDYQMSQSLDKDIESERTPSHILKGRERRLKWWHENKDTQLPKQAEYRENHREILNAKSRQYHAEHREQDNQRNLASYYSNHEENKKKQRDAKRARYKANPEYYRQKQREYRRKKKGEQCEDNKKQ